MLRTPFRPGRVVIAVVLCCAADGWAQQGAYSFSQTPLRGPWTVRPACTKGMTAPDDPGRIFVALKPNGSFQVAPGDVPFAAGRRADKVWLADRGILVYAALENAGGGLYALMPDGAVSVLAHYPTSPVYEGLLPESGLLFPLRPRRATAAAERRVGPFYLLTDEARAGAKPAPALYVWDGTARKRLVGVGDTIQTPAGPSEIAYLHIKDQGGGAALVEYRKSVPPAQRRKGYGMVGASDLERSPAGWLLVQGERVTPLLADGAPIPGTNPPLPVDQLAPRSLQTNDPWVQRPARFASDGTLYGAVDHGPGRRSKTAIFRLSPEKSERIIGERDPDPLRPGKQVPYHPRLIGVSSRGAIVAYYEPVYPGEYQKAVALFRRDGKAVSLVPAEERLFAEAPLQVSNLVCTDEPRFACYYLGVQYTTGSTAVFASTQLFAADENGPRGPITPMPLSLTSYFDVVGGPHPGIFLHAVTPQDLTKNPPEKAFEFDLFLNLAEEKPTWELVPAFEGQAFNLADVVSWRSADEAIVQLPDGLHIATREPAR